jgi:DNA-binding transcriptional LysR family regulator
MKLELSTQKLKNHSSTSMQFLTIGCIHETYLPLLTPLLSRCREEFPMIHPFFRMIPFRAAYQLFIHNEIDILFGFQEDLSMPEGFTYQEIRSLSICFVMREDHPLANEELLTEEDILSERLVLCNSFDIPARVASLQTQLTHRFSPDQTNYCENVPAMLTLIRSGYGIGILPKIPESEKQITCVPITDTSSLSYGVFYRNHPENPLTNDFLSLLDV